MATPLTYTTLQTALLSMLAQAPPPYNVVPPDFAQLYPRAISFAESRICAEIPFLANQKQDSTLLTTAGSRVLDLASMSTPIIVLDRVALITPASTTPEAGTRNQYIQTTTDFIDMFWPNEATTANPATSQNIGRYWANRTKGNVSTYTVNQIIIAPTPDGVYRAECTGLFQPTPLSSGNPQTFLSTTYPDLLTAGCMVFLEGALMRNFGAQGDSPREALSWEAVYQGLKSAAEFEEMRSRGILPDMPRGPAPTTQPGG